MTVKIKGLSEMKALLKQRLNARRSAISEVRKQVAKALVENIIENVPVWSGRAVRSVRVVNGPSNSRGEPHPDRGDFSKDGIWDSHKADFGDTRNQPLGSEKLRGSSEAVALQSVDSANYSTTSRVFVTSSSYMWDIIEDASYRGDESRNSAIVSAIAIANVKASFRGRVK